MRVGAIHSTRHRLRIVRRSPVGIREPRYFRCPLAPGVAPEFRFDAVLHEPSPPFSLSGTIRILQLSNLFGHFVMGELYLALGLLLRSESRYHFQHALTVNEALDCLTGLVLAIQLQQMTAERIARVPQVARDPSDAGVGSETGCSGMCRITVRGQTGVRRLRNRRLARRHGKFPMEARVSVRSR